MIPAPPSLIRFYCVAQPGPAGEFGALYLAALAETGFPVRAVPIGVMLASIPPWGRFAHLFGTPMPDEKFINVVCAPGDLPLGHSFSRRDAGAAVAGGPAGAAAGAELAYRADTAVAMLHTPGRRNVLITETCPTNGELEPMRRYDYVFTSSNDQAANFRQRGIEAFYLPAEVEPVKQVFAAMVLML